MHRVLFLSMAFVLAGGIAVAGEAQTDVEKILEQYFRIQSALAKDTVEGVDQAAAVIARLASAARAADPEVKKLLSEVEKAAAGLRGKKLKEARLEFFELTKPLFIYVHKHYSGEKDFSRYYCSMAKKGWIQKGKEVRNPYYGASMLNCGDLVP